jgi:tripartite-type tricarboxylate transporter receptor subunit TctC
VAGFVAAARAGPGQLRVAHFGQGGASHLPAELLCRVAGIAVAFVPCKSEADSFPDLALQ